MLFHLNVFPTFAFISSNLATIVLQFSMLNLTILHSNLNFMHKTSEYTSAVLLVAFDKKSEAGGLMSRVEKKRLFLFSFWLVGFYKGWI